MELIKVLYVPEEGTPQMLEINNDLDEFQKLVKGYIEIVTLFPEIVLTVTRNSVIVMPKIVLVCNDEGVLNAMKVNSVVPKINQAIYGPYFIAGVMGEDLCSLEPMIRIVE